MECTVCQGASAREESVPARLVDDQTCPACGRPTSSVEAMSEESVVRATRIVESSADGQELRVSYMPTRVHPRDLRALVLTKPQYPTLAALAQLPALAWRQPVVHAAVKTGASAVALSVALRVAGRMLASRGAREGARESLLPTLADLIAPTETDALPLRRARRVRSARGEQVSEVFIYMRRTIVR